MESEWGSVVTVAMESALREYRRTRYDAQVWVRLVEHSQRPIEKAFGNMHLGLYHDNHVALSEARTVFSQMEHNLNDKEREFSVVCSLAIKTRLQTNDKFAAATHNCPKVMWYRWANETNYTVIQYLYDEIRSIWTQRIHSEGRISKQICEKVWGEIPLDLQPGIEDLLPVECHPLTWKAELVQPDVNDADALDVDAFDYDGQLNTTTEEDEHD